MQADQEKIANLLKTARGQIDGIIRMTEEDRYCIDIVNQITAVESILKKANQEILRAHMESCVKSAFESGDGTEKIDEILTVLDKLN